MKLPTLLGFGVLLFVLIGCQSTPSPHLGDSRNDWIEDGTTTFNEVTNRLGMPHFLQTTPGSSVADYYYFHEQKTTQGKIMGSVSEVPRIDHFNAISVVFGKNGVAIAHWEHQSSQPVRPAQLEGGPRLRYGPSLEPETVARIQHGVSTEKDLAAWFGEPSLAFMGPDKNLTLVWIEGTLASSISRHWNHRALSVVLDDHGTVGRHSTMETESLREAMGGLLSR